MDDILRFLVVYEAWIYAILGIGGLVYLQRVLFAVREWRGASFGLEKENARYRFSVAMTILLVFLFLGLAEFFTVTFYYPSRQRSTVLATPTVEILTTPTATLLSGTRPAATATGLRTTLSPVISEGCTPGTVEWTFPKNGGELKGTVDLKGTVNVPNLGFYKYEYSPVGSSEWTTIAAGNTKTFVGAWNTAQLTPGDYRLRLVVADNQNKILPACVVTIRIVSP